VTLGTGETATKYAKQAAVKGKDVTLRSTPPLAIGAVSVSACTSMLVVVGRIFGLCLDPQARSTLPSHGFTVTVGRERRGRD
jgi:hypothetical protein